MGEESAVRGGGGGREVGAFVVEREGGDFMRLWREGVFLVVVFLE